MVVQTKAWAEQIGAKWGTNKLALEQTINAKRLVTDETKAMELAGYHPWMVEGRPNNIKITRRTT